jgi:hypothetical protein
VQRCQGAPSTWPIAFFSPSCASETTSGTPVKPRLTTPRRKSRQNASVSHSPQSRPIHLAPTRLVHAVRDHHALPHDAAAVADLLHLGVEPDVAGAALERPAAERVDLLIKASADARDLALGDPQPERLDQLVNLSRRDAAHVRLLDHADQCLLAAAARLEERRNVRAAPDLRNRQLDLAGACVPAARPVAVAMRQPLRVALAVLGADHLRHLSLHQLLHDPPQRLAQKVDPLPALEQGSQRPARTSSSSNRPSWCSFRRSLGRNRRV